MKWLYKNKEINEISDLPNNAFGFVYQTTHLPTSKKYIGKKSLIYNLKKKLGKKEKHFGKVKVDLLSIKEYLKKVIGKTIMVHMVLLKKQIKKI